MPFPIGTRLRERDVGHGCEIAPLLREFQEVPQDRQFIADRIRPDLVRAFLGVPRDDGLRQVADRDIPNTP
jgi:hypothetical protein